MNWQIQQRLVDQFTRRYGAPPEVVAYAPGRVEVLGNHTDYNEGFVLSAAINYGTFFAARRALDGTCLLTAGDLRREVQFAAAQPRPVSETSWSNYVRGVWAKLLPHGRLTTGFQGMFLGDVPLGAGLSSSAALEIAAGLALAELFGLRLTPLDLARIGQAAEHEFVGVKCGLLDQITSLFGQEDHLVLTDFRSLATEAVAFGEHVCFLICNTRVKHSLVDSAYNERRERCEEAARFFASVLPHPVAALRDVSLAEWRQFADRLDPVAARRAAHVIGENDRVLRGREMLAQGRLAEFGELMLASHASSRQNFENSCPELDFVVQAAAETRAVGARLSGGGFGGSAVVLVHPQDATAVGQTIAERYARRFCHPCDMLVIAAAAGARVLDSRKKT